MNSLTMERRIRFERDALDHILDQRRGFDRARMKQVISAEAAVSPAFARRRARIVQLRGIVGRQGNAMVVAGALAVVATSVWIAMSGLDLAMQVGVMLLGAVVLGLFWLVLNPEGPGNALMAGIWGVASLLPLAGLEMGGIDVALLMLGWLAIGARAWLQGRMQGLDRDEVQLMLDAQGREAHVEQMRRQVAALI